MELSVFEMIAKSEERPGVSVSVSELLPATGSVIPTGAVTDAVFDKFTVALEDVFAVTI